MSRRGARDGMLVVDDRGWTVDVNWNWKKAPRFNRASRDVNAAP
jgi:hypothetical protein